MARIAETFRRVSDSVELLDPLNHVSRIFLERGGFAVDGDVNRARVSLAKVSFGCFVDQSGGIPATTGRIVSKSVLEIKTRIWGFVLHCHLPDHSTIVNNFESGELVH